MPLAAARAGYRPLGVFPIRNSYPLEYWITHAPIPFRGALAKAAEASGLGRLRLPLSLGNIGMVARKPAEG